MQVPETGSSLERICRLIADPVRPELGSVCPTPAAIIGAGLVLLEEGVLAARRIDREALGHVVRGRSARLDPDQILTVASVQLASARCTATLLEDLDVPDWRPELKHRASEIKPEDPLTAMLFASVGLGQVLVELDEDRQRAGQTLFTVVAAAAASAAGSADLASALNAARATPPPIRPSRAARRRRR